MRKVFQTRSDAQSGNCFEACVASLLERELNEVPVYREGNERMQPYLERLDQWLEPQGLGVVAINVAQKTSDDGTAPDRLPDFVGPHTPWIASVDLHDFGHLHAVVMRGRHLWHDPQEGSVASELPDLHERLMAAFLFVPHWHADSQPARSGGS